MTISPDSSLSIFPQNSHSPPQHSIKHLNSESNSSSMFKIQTAANSPNCSIYPQLFTNSPYDEPLIPHAWKNSKLKEIAQRQKSESSKLSVIYANEYSNSKIYKRFKPAQMTLHERTRSVNSLCLSSISSQPPTVNDSTQTTPIKNTFEIEKALDSLTLESPEISEDDNLMFDLDLQSESDYPIRSMSFHSEQNRSINKKEHKRSISSSSSTSYHVKCPWNTPLPENETLTIDNSTTLVNSINRQQNLSNTHLSSRELFSAQSSSSVSSNGPNSDRIRPRRIITTQQQQCQNMNYQQYYPIIQPPVAVRSLSMSKVHIKNSQPPTILPRSLSSSLLSLQRATNSSVVTSSNTIDHRTLESPLRTQSLHSTSIANASPMQKNPINEEKEEFDLDYGKTIIPNTPQVGSCIFKLER